MAGLHVEVGGEAPLPLEQAEPLQGLGAEGRDLRRAPPVDEGPPEPVARRLHHEPVRIVDLGPEVVEPFRAAGARPVLPVHEHAGERGEAEPLDRPARVERGVDPHPRGCARLHDEAVGAREARAVEEREDRDRPRAVLRLADPVGHEIRKLLRRGQAGPDRRAAGREPVFLAGAPQTEVGGAEEDEELLLRLRPRAVEGVVQAEAREAEARGKARSREPRPEIEQARLVGHGPRRALPRLDEQVDALALQEAPVEELGREQVVQAQALSRPEGDGAVAVVAEGGELRGQVVRLRPVGRGGERRGPGAQRLEAHRPRRLLNRIARHRSGDIQVEGAR
ncbi:hypothetical protein LDDCCGHA_2820 [Methylobacterium oxalidis]|nr:hypothetical protein LDDCCGHA_2820 [Methylobacterium oxalidis]